MPSEELAPSTIPSPSYNQILILNDDCILEIFSYIDHEDKLCMAAAHPRLAIPYAEDLKRNKVTAIEINGKSDKFPIYLYRCPVETFIHVYEAISSFVTTITFNDVTEDDFFKILSHFKTLRTLIIKRNWRSRFHLGNISTCLEENNFPPLKCLVLDDNYNTCKGEPSEMSKLFFGYINTTLTQLTFRNPSSNALQSCMPLENLVYLTLYESMMKDPLMSMFLEQNIKLKHIQICMSGGDEAKAWDTMAKMRSLKVLWLSSLCKEGNYPVFENLEEAIVEIEEPHGNCLEPFLNKMGPQLKSLYMY